MPFDPTKAGEPAYQCVYHYTDVNGVLGILQHDCLWANSVYAMNDRSEFNFALSSLAAIYANGWDTKRVLEVDPAESDRRIHEVISHLAYGTGDVYALCASKLPNDLSQWRAYGQSGGFAVKLPTPSYMNLRLLDDKGRGYDLDGCWELVTYGVDESRNKLLALLDYMARDDRTSDILHGLTHARQVLATIKSEEFAVEQEVRYVVSYERFLGRPLPFVSYRSGRYGLTPYVRLGFAEVGQPTIPMRQVLPAIRVGSGPGDWHHVSMSGLRSLLGGSAVMIRSASQNFRSS